MKFILGVDPGMTGAIAMLDHHGNLITYYDINGVDGRVNVAEANRWLLDRLNGQFPIAMAVVENVHAMPNQGQKMGAQTSFKFGRACGAIESLVQAHFIPMDLLTPAQWKSQMKMTKKDKDYPRQWCQRRWPTVDAFNLKGKGQARADAACIALAWLELHPEFREGPSKKPPPRRR